MRSLILILLFLTFSVPAAPPAARFELLSIPQVSQAASRLGNAIAPRFRDTAAAVTLVLTMGTVRYGMDLTRPAEIHFYSFGEKPAMRIIAHALPEVKAPEDNAKFWNILFHARRKDGLVVFDSEGVNGAFPSVPPGKNLKNGELLRGMIQTEAVQKYYRFASFNTKDPASRLILSGLDELLKQLKTAEVIFSADENALKVELAVRPKERSAVSAWIKQPLPPKGRIETYPGARTLAVLRLNPTETLRRYGQLYLEESGKKPLPPVFAATASGFAVLAADNKPWPLWSMRLTAGIDPGRAQPVRNEILKKYKETPFRGWYSIGSDPVLLCSSGADRLVFFCAARMDTGNISALAEPKEYAGSVPDCPFVCLDLSRPEKPLVQLLFERNAMHLVLQAPDSWFAGCGPHLEKPLLLPQKRQNP